MVFAFSVQLALFGLQVLQVAFMRLKPSLFGAYIIRLALPQYVIGDGLVGFGVKRNTLSSKLKSLF